MAALFVVTYGVIALSYARQRATVWFMVSYLFGFLTPICHLLVLYTDQVALFSILGYGVFLGGILMMAVGIQAFVGHRPPWRFALLLWGAGMALRLAIWGGPRNTMPYELLFQLPFAIGSAVVMLAACRIEQTGPIRAMLIGIFGAIGAHFLIKPFLVLSLGSGATPKVYLGSVYAAISQISTGVLLVGAGLCLLLLVIQKALEETILDAETDPLTGLANRRGLHRVGPRMMAEAMLRGEGLHALVLDLDHFKAINDRHGHAMGDTVLVAFARVLRDIAARDMLAVRMGGEEFAILIPDAHSNGTDNRAMRLGDALRDALHLFAAQGLPALTVSGGVVHHRAGETLEGMIARGDQLAYRAKRAGRDRILQEPIDRSAEREGIDWTEMPRLATG
ncbi:GGDEF domain-containing protein [Sphingomonas sanguinis]|uniref:diguanylate cyclase n=1 Tax=Sphingomonas sanguinis TaxID=33051 RepID=A0ABU5LVE7_9SPHN|nr:GGDEF domain-containing protein [Sphingomonas sanguinis]MDZ7283906.1 GGDEF domain-containing protein [Sphingomonas sanguinis]